MPFQPVSEHEDHGSGGNFPTRNRQFYNFCGRLSYCGSLSFQDAKHNARLVPIFLDDCLEDKPQSYTLMKKLWKMVRGDMDHTGATLNSIRSIHQNEYGYLPYTGGTATRRQSAAPYMYMDAIKYGELPNNQKQANQKDRGQFQEYTFGDDLAQEARFVVDFRFGLLYMTLGHYHADSFALLVRSRVSMELETKPALSLLGVQIIP
ncbi:hypothetical protein [Insolitispirillum peregrinum]|uniref:Uncharacterized protein n=1 Tax=Insolitispirillum peregrinum TaxID=80876 RepID=A0A1N7Q703_9PROT|nr:hypothetical protein [Insolitispirillum peregrinum]SIT18614.1 hypothetical protein SAMN05421779_11143 [Insolitispirillum peregrinum]